MSPGINALRRQIRVPRVNPVLLAPGRTPSLIPTGSRLLSSSSSTSPPLDTVRLEHVRPPLVAGSSSQLLGHAIAQLDNTEAELIATLDEYKQSAEKGQHPTLRLSATLDDGYPLGKISQVRQKRVYKQTDSPLVAPFRRYPSRNETNASAQRHRKHLYSHIWGESHFFNADWDKTYANLSKLTPYPTEWLSRAIQIYLTPPHVRTLSKPEPGNHLWEISQRTGALLQMEKYIDPKDGEQQCLILSGQEQHLRKCVAEMIALLGEFRAKKLPPSTTSTHPPRHQQYPTERLRIRRGYLRRTTGRTVHDFYTPTVWTRATLEEYIGWLVSSLPNVEAQSEYVRRHEEHQYVTVLKLMRVLGGDVGCAPQECLTTSAYKLALSFMAQKGTVFFKELWALFQLMPSLRVPYDTEVFNVMFEHCAKCGNMMRFNMTLIMMHRLGFEPDLLTWQMFLRMTKAPMHKRKIVHDIRTRGLLRSPFDKANISMEMVQHDLEHFIRSHQDTSQFNISEFIAQQDAEYGDHKWLGLNTFKRIVDTLGRFSLFRDCFRSVLYLARVSSNLRPSVDSFNHILLHMYRQQSKRNITFPKMAIKTIRALEQVRKTLEAEDKHVGKAHLYKPNAQTFHLLFHLAYRLQLPNFMAVVWRYAVMHDLTTNWMRLKVTRYLVFGRLGNAKTAPVLLRSYVRRLFMDEILMRSLDRTLMNYLQLKRREEIIHLARMRGEAAIKYMDLSKEEIPDQDETEAPVEEDADDGAEPSAAPELAQSVPELVPEEVPRDADNYSEVPRDGENHSEVPRDGENHSEVPRDGENHSEVPVEADPPEAWHTNATELSLLALWRSEAAPKRSFDYDIWYRHGLAVAREYRREFRDWKPKWDLSEALSYALARDIRLRDCVARWDAIEYNIRRGKHRNGISHAMWLRTVGRRLIPNPIRVPVYNKLPYGLRWRSFGGDSNDVILLHFGPEAEKMRREARNKATKARKQMKPYIDAGEFAALFSHVQSPEGNEVGGWENLLSEHGHNVG